MQIQLRQAEIIAALKAYITNQGISLVDKTVDIKFTAGRKDSGLSADIQIEDAPNTGEATEVATTVVGTVTDAKEAAAKPTLAVVAPVAEAALVDTVKEEATKAPSASLFG